MSIDEEIIALAELLESPAIRVDPVEKWDHAFWCLTAAFLWFGGLLPPSNLGVWIPPWWLPDERRWGHEIPPAPPRWVRDTEPRPVIPSSSVDRAAALALAQDLVDYRAKSMVAGGRELAQWVLGGADAEATIAGAARVAELLEDRNRLCAGVRRLAAAHPDERDALIAELVTACRGLQ